MVAGFRRSLSLPGPKSRAPEKPSHVRSTSLPCNSHPAVALVEEEIRALRAWQAGPAPEARSPAAWIKAGLDRLELLHTALGGLLALPQAQDTLRRPGGCAGRLLDALLLFADAYGTLRSASVALSDHASEARAAIRHLSASRLASAVRSQKKAAREVAHLAAAIRGDTKSSPISSLGSKADTMEVELAGILREVTAVTAAASVAIFSRTAAVSSAASAAAAESASPLGLWMVGPLKKLASKKRRFPEEAIEKAALEKLEGLEECVEALEKGSERVFRSLVISRVSLLNILTPTL